MRARLKLCLLGVAGLAAVGCGSLKPASAPSAAALSPQCQSIDDAAMNYGAVAVLGGGLAASSGGLTSIPGESTNARIGLAAGAIVAGAIAAGAAYLEHAKSAEYVAAGCGR